LDVLAFELRRQPIVHAPVGEESSPEKAGGERDGGPRPAHFADEKGAGDQARPPRAGQALLQLQERGARGKGQRKARGTRRHLESTRLFPSPLTVPRKFLRKWMPDADAVRANRAIAPFARWLTHPNLWHLNRRSVPGAVAIGLFSGLVPGPLQMLTALLLAVPLRKNLPVALLSTFYTNPFTIVPLYLLAYQYGSLLLGSDQRAGKLPMYEMDWGDWLGSMQALFDWAMSLGKPLGVGLVALGLTLAGIGYVATRVGWRLYVILAWRARRKKRRR
jgi:uncharacterized protein (DUF2062 family)